MNYKIGYSFDLQTKRFICAEKVYIEAKTGRYPCASNVVFTEPPATREHEGAYWDGLKWGLHLDEGYIDDGGIREMTQVERIEHGIDKLDDDMKIEEGEIVPKTRDDFFAEGKLTVEEYNRQVDAERQARYMSETDPMAMMYLRGECTKEEWLSAMDKIRQELPKK